jgi:hypothetical protein
MCGWALNFWKDCSHFIFRVRQFKKSAWTAPLKVQALLFEMSVMLCPVTEHNIPEHLNFRNTAVRTSKLEFIYMFT